MSSPSESELNGRHMQRFRMICNAAKGMNVSIWVIAFGTTLSSRDVGLREQRQPGVDDRATATR